MELGPGVKGSDYEKAVADLRNVQSYSGPVGQAWCARAIDHLNTTLDNYLRERPTIRTEQQALALIQTIAGNLAAAAEGLQWAAARMRSKGDAHGASETMKRAMQVREQAQELIGSE